MWGCITYIAQEEEETLQYNTCQKHNLTHIQIGIHTLIYNRVCVCVYRSSHIFLCLNWNPLARVQLFLFVSFRLSFRSHWWLWLFARFSSLTVCPCSSVASFFLNMSEYFYNDCFVCFCLLVLIKRLTLTFTLVDIWTSKHAPPISISTPIHQSLRFYPAKCLLAISVFICSVFNSSTGHT